MFKTICVWHLLIVLISPMATLAESGTKLTPSGNVQTATFTRINTGDLVNDGGVSPAVCWVDYDNDGFVDLFVTRNDGFNCLYHNNGDGTFAKLAGDIIVTDGDGGHADWSSSWCDIDNDGDLDAFVGTAAESSPPKNRFYTNNGDGSFTKSVAGIISLDSSNAVGCSWVDFDLDGDLDLFTSNHGTWPPSQFGPNTLYRNDDGAFTKLNNTDIGLDEIYSNSCTWSDYDSDGDPDLFVTRLSDHTNALFANNADGTFSAVTSGNIVNDAGNSYSSSWADYDNDGDLDLFVANLLAQDDFLYENLGDGSFSSVEGQVIVGDGGWSVSSCWGDCDNDGDVDLFVTARQYGVPTANRLYWNEGDGTFTRQLDGAIVTDLGGCNGAAWADYDHDGDLDLFVTDMYDATANNRLYRNDGNGNNWLSVRCIGTVSNRSAIGTKVFIKASIAGVPTWQLREISSQTGHGSMNDLTVHFGLADAVLVDSIRIEWPGGMVGHLAEVAVNQFLVVTEGEQCCLYRGDIDHAGNGIDISDLVYLVDYMFTGGPAPACETEGDVDGSSSIDISDLVYLVDFMFTGGPAPGACP